MHALPAAPDPAPRRQVFVGTALAMAAAASLVGALLALWLRLRHEAISGIDGRWMPKDVTVPLVPANVMLIALLPICIFAQWAVYSAKRDDKPHTALALGLVGLLGLAFVNAQAFIYATMKVPANQGSFSVMFYTVTGAAMLLAIIGIMFSAATAFRYLGGRTTDRETVSAHALYWYAFSAVFAVLWFVVYVTK
jgi:heme/copper-type cytochrome/quinol oxidase subunit 3